MPLDDLTRLCDRAKDIASPRLLGYPAMTLNFPNGSRSYDAKKSLVRFWGYERAVLLMNRHDPSPNTQAAGRTAAGADPGRSANSSP